MERRSCAERNRRIAFLVALVLVAVVGTLLGTVRESKAIPAWARKYNADCSMCHYPVVPRLNSFGQQFRRAGYRTPDEFNKEQDVTKVGDFLSARTRVRFGYENKLDQIERTEFTLNDVTLFYAGAFSRNFSGFLEPEMKSNGEVELVGQLQGVFGKSDRYVSVRMGQMHPFFKVGFGGWDRPSGISASPVFAAALTRAGAINGANFTFAKDQKGIELAFVQGRGRLVAQVLNGLNTAGSGTASKTDIDADKDYFVAYEHILDDIASGLTAFYYKGAYPNASSPAGSATPTAVSQRFNFYRLGITANKIFPVGFGFFELQGGYVRSSDNVSAQIGPNVQGNAVYVESQQVFTGPEITFLERFSLIDMDTASRAVSRKDYMVGVVAPVQTWLRAAAEYTYTSDIRVAGTSGHSALIELQANW